MTFFFNWRSVSGNIKHFFCKSVKIIINFVGAANGDGAVTYDSYVLLAIAYKLYGL